MKVFVVGNSINYVNFISNAEITEDIKEAQLVVFTGGEDVDPSLYGCEKHHTTYSNLKRDMYEKDVFDKIDPKTQVCLGICRGSQFLTVMNGGLLVQNVEEHAIGYTHGIVRPDGDKIYQITSTHHQMMYPFNLSNKDYKLLYISWGCGNYTYEGDKIDAEKVYENEPEIVYYHKEGKPKCLAVQGHPEMIPHSITAKMIDELIKDLIDGNL